MDIGAVKSLLLRWSSSALSHLIKEMSGGVCSWLFSLH